MYHNIILCLLFLAFGAFVFLLGFNIYRKLMIINREKKTTSDRKIIFQKIEKFIDGSELVFKKGLDEFVKDAVTRSKTYRDVVDEYLMYILGILDIANRDRYIQIAWRLNFSSDCLEQIRNKKPEISALGCRRAGLYKYREAIEDMINALEIISSENQFEILLALARMGEANALQRAFIKIKDSILVNERAVIQILASFPKGEAKLKLFRNMINCGTDYITALFLKALGIDMAAPLTDDIIAALHKGNKDVRAAAVRSLAVLGKNAPAYELIKAMEDHEWEVRSLAAKALEVIIKPNASLALYKALFDQQWWVRQNAAQSLTNHPGYESLFILAAESGDEYTKDSIFFILEKIGNPVLLRSIKIMAA